MSRYNYEILPAKYRALRDLIQGSDNAFGIMSDWDLDLVEYEIVDDDYIDVHLWKDTYISFRFNDDGNIEMRVGHYDNNKWVEVEDKYDDNFGRDFWFSAYVNKQ